MVSCDRKRYIDDYDEGLGTVYERFKLNGILEQLRRKYGIQSVLEAPIEGMTGVPGINSVELAKNGCSVTLVDTDDERLSAVRGLWTKLGLSDKASFQVCEDMGGLPFADSSFDLVWNFASLWHVKEAEKLLSEMARVAKKAVFISMPNTIQVGYLLRRLYQREFFGRVNTEWCNMKKIEGILAKSGLKVTQRGVFDVPPWPDTCFPAVKFMPSKGRKKWRWSMMDYYLGGAQQYDAKMRKYSLLEDSNLPLFLKKLWAHHNHILATKDG
jgi:SAM-dependent methyltransferase